MAPTAITQALEDFLEAAWRRTAVLNRTMIGLAQSNLKFGFELARAKTLSDVLSLQADYWQEQWHAFQADESCNKPSGAGEPPSAPMPKPQPVETASVEEDGPSPQLIHTRAKAVLVERSVLVIAPEMPQQTPARRPAPKQAAPAPQPEAKGAKGRAKAPPRRPASNEARTSERKGRAPERDAASPSGPGKIQFGMLDGNAVRFTSAEAWALLEGAWKKVSVKEVLSDAVVLSQARFDQLYPEVPQLPASAFKPKAKPKG
jgi:hypothetical protein